jgi:hypothetical protein
MRQPRSTVTSRSGRHQAKYEQISQDLSDGGSMADDREPTPPGGLNPNALTPADAARLLSKAGGKAVPVELIEKDVTNGAPTNADGTINLVHYAAWLVKEMGRGD